MFNVSGPEFLIVLVVALIVLGPDKLPDALRKAGRLFAEVRRITSGLQDELRDALNEATAIPSTPDAPPAPPAEAQPQPEPTPPAEAERQPEPTPPAGAERLSEISPEVAEVSTPPEPLSTVDAVLPAEPAGANDDEPSD